MIVKYTATGLPSVTVVTREGGGTGTDATAADESVV